MKKTITAVKALRTGYGAVQTENLEFSTKGEKHSDERAPLFPCCVLK